MPIKETKSDATSIGVGSGIRAAKSRLTIPDHELIRPIGEGAYGEVWLARNVLGGYRAVKAVFRASFKTAEPYEREFRGIQRFEPISRSNEGLVDILQVGRNDAEGCFYYVMELADDANAECGTRSAELVECSEFRLQAASRDRSAATAEPAKAGTPNEGSVSAGIETYTPKTLRREIHQRTRLKPEECVQLGMNLSLALAHLHRHGLIHRDIKPSNIIFVGGIPKLADIGLVTDLSDAQSFVGTEGFIPPEGPNTPQADIYSLGKVLYEISMGKDRKDFPEPATLLGDSEDSERLEELNAVILKACASNPAERYQTAEELNADLALLNSGKSVKSRRRLEKRLALLTRLAAVITIAAGVALGAYAFQRHQTAEARRLAEENRRLAGGESRQRQRAQETLQHLEFQRAHEQFESGQASLALAYLARSLRRDPSNGLAAERLLSALSHRQYALPRFELPHNAKPASAIFSPDGSRIVTAGQDGHARIWETVTGKLLFELSHDHELVDAHFSHNSRWILTRDRTGTVQVWDAISHQPVAPPVPHAGATIAEFSPDDERFITGGADGMVRIWKTRTSALVGDPLVPGKRVNEARFSADGTRLATGGEGSVIVWDAANGRRLFEVPGVRSVYFSPDSRRLVTVPALEARVWDAHSGQLVSRLGPHKFPIQSCRFSPDGRRVVTASNDQTVRIWDTETGVPLGRPMQHGDGVLYARFTANGERLFTLSSDCQFRFWNVETGELVAEPTLLDMERRVGGAGAQLSPDERWLLVFSDSGVRLWDIRYGAVLPLAIQPEIDFERLHKNFVRFARFDSKGTKVLTGNSQFINSGRWGRSDGGDAPSVARVWSAATAGPISPPVRHEQSISLCEFSADGRWVVSSSREGIVQVWNAESGDARISPLRHSNGVSSACFSRDGRLVATACRDGFVRVWNADSGQELQRFSQSNEATPARARVPARFVQFSPDSSLLIATFADDPANNRGTEPSARIWNVATGALQAVLAHRGLVFLAVFSPDGARVVTTQFGEDGARVWNARTGQPITDWLHHNDSVTFAEFSRDGERVVTSSSDRSARIWDSRTGRLLAGPLKHGWEVITARFSPDGRRVVTASWDQTAQLWDAFTGLPISEPFRHSDWVHGAEFSPDGNRVLTAMVRQNAQIWEAVTPTLPVPAWLPGLAEALGGQRLDDDGNLQRISWDESMKLRAELALISSDAPMGQWLRWFLADRETRLISPSASVTVTQYVQRRLDDDSLESLTQALQVAPLHPQVLSRLGRKLLIADSMRNTQQTRADWLTRLALQLAPEDASVWSLRADVLEALNRLEESQAALTKALEMASTDPHALFMKAVLAHRAGEKEAAYQTYLKVLDGVCGEKPERDSGASEYLPEGFREIRAVGKLDSEKYADLAALRERRRPARNQIEAEWLRRKAEVPAVR